MRDLLVFTIGHGGRTVSDMIDQLRNWDIQFIVDVRSAPYSSYQPEFSQGPLSKTLADASLRYGFMGQQLGGRPNDPSCYTENGNVDYDQCRSRFFFQEGISRLRNACEQGYSVCLLCSERNPKNCHRSALIGESLTEVGVEVVHLLPEGGHKHQSDVMQERNGGQLSFFGAVSRKVIPSRGDLR